MPNRQVHLHMQASKKALGLVAQVSLSDRKLQMQLPLLTCRHCVPGGVAIQPTLQLVVKSVQGLRWCHSVVLHAHVQRLKVACGDKLAAISNQNTVFTPLLVTGQIKPIKACTSSSVTNMTTILYAFAKTFAPLASCLLSNHITYKWSSTSMRCSNMAVLCRSLAWTYSSSTEHK